MEGARRAVIEEEKLVGFTLPLEIVQEWATWEIKPYQALKAAAEETLQLLEMGQPRAAENRLRLALKKRSQR